MLNIAIILGSTRPGRRGEAVAKWVNEIAQKRKDARFELIDIRAYDLPFLDEPIPAANGEPYTKLHTKRWSQLIAPFDAFIFVAPEYNHGTSAALKNAIDFLYVEWNDKAAGFVSYGSTGGIRAVEQLRLVMAEIKIAAVRSQVSLNLYTDWVNNFETFKPDAHHQKSVNKMIDEVIALGELMKAFRAKSKEKAA